MVFFIYDQIQGNTISYNGAVANGIGYVNLIMVLKTIYKCIYTAFIAMLIYTWILCGILLHGWTV